MQVKSLWEKAQRSLRSLTYSLETEPASVTVQRRWLGCSLGRAEFTYEIWMWCSNEFVVGVWDEMLMCGRQSSLLLWVLKPHSLTQRHAFREKDVSAGRNVTEGAATRSSVSTAYYWLTCRSPFFILICWPCEKSLLFLQEMKLPDQPI